MSHSCSDLYYVQLVYEYLLHMGMENTAEQFKEDCRIGNIPNPGEPDGIKRRHISDLIQLFDDENEFLFFKVFESVLPKEVQFSLEYKKLMVDLMVYFAALSILKQDGYDGNMSFKPLVHLPPRISQLETRRMPVLQNMRSNHSHSNFETLEQYGCPCGKHCEMSHCMCTQGNRHANTFAGNRSLAENSLRNSPVQPGMYALLNFLEKECSSLKDHPYFLPYFSLPFTAHPQTHPRFKHIFQDSWVGCLRRKLWDFLVLHRQAAKIPDVVFLLPPTEVPSQEYSSSPHATKYAHFQKKAQPSQLDGVSVSNSNSLLLVETSPDHCVPEAFSSCLSGNQEPEDNLRDVSHAVEIPSLPLSLYKGGSKLDKSFDFVSNNLERNSPEVVTTDNQWKSPCHAIPYIPPRKSQSRTVHHAPKASMIKPAVQGINNNATNLSDSLQNYENLKLRYHQLHSDYHNLIGVAAELTGALENSIKGHQVDLKEILKNCLHIFPELFHPNSHHHFYQNSVASNQTEEEIFTLKDPAFELIDINKVKTSLNDSNVKLRLLLLQALRWRITQTSKINRQYVIKEYVEGDLFNIHKKENDILKDLLMPLNVETPHPLQQATARLINALASLKPGRDYLAQSCVVVNVVCQVLKQCQNILTDDTTKDMLVASIQKLSLRRNQRVAMIESGMVEWLVQHLTNMSVHHPYRVEYSTALLMNLCLHRSAKLCCIPLAQSVFTLLFELLSTPVDQALLYINGVLYSLITNPELNATAAQMGLVAVLESKITTQENPHLQKQMEHIVLFHRNSILSQTTDSVPQENMEGEMMDDDTEDIDLLEEELDDKDPVRSVNGELCGDALLRSHYTISLQFHDSDEPFKSAGVIAGHPVSFLLICPSTPLHCADSEGVVVAEARNQWKDRSKEDRRPSLPSVQANKSYHFHPRSSLSRRGSQFRTRGTKNGKPGSRASKDNLPKQALKHPPSKSEQTTTAVEDLIKDTEDPKLSSNSVGPPEITIDYASSRDRSSDENDVEDVQVGFSVTQIVEALKDQAEGALDEDNEMSTQIFNVDRDGTSDVKDHEEKGCEAAAFVSRPKIPRTPPH